MCKTCEQDVQKVLIKMELRKSLISMKELADLSSLNLPLLQNEIV
jgi:hypothetical protein